MKKSFGIVIILIFLCGLMVSQNLKDLDGKTVKIKYYNIFSKKFYTYLGIVVKIELDESSYGYNKIYLKPGRDKWHKELYKKNKDIWDDPKTEDFIYDNADYKIKIYVVEPGKEDILVYDNESVEKERLQKIEDARPVKTVDVGTLENATGWRKNNDGKWISYEKVIPRASDKSTPTADGTDNFRILKLQKITYKDQTFMMLWKKYKRGSIKYKHLRMGYKSEVNNGYWIFQKEELNKLKEIKDGQHNIIKIKLINNFMISGDETDVRDYLARFTEYFEEKPGSGTLDINIIPDKSQNKVKFLIYHHYINYRKEETIDSGIQELPLNIVTSEKLFDHAYFETTYEGFNNFLNIE
jgi:hypothetical protein